MYEGGELLPLGEGERPGAVVFSNTESNTQRAAVRVEGAFGHSGQIGDSGKGVDLPDDTDPDANGSGGPPQDAEEQIGPGRRAVARRAAGCR
ncbi:hypothetical protein ACIHDR_49195 [Nocardia sp. NPDC052278]|uniref:hypothetical protein n=1 Tax=unclassified Nocardia TaxID=2637762 RepID=UPI0036786B6C